MQDNAFKLAQRDFGEEFVRFFLLLRGEDKEPLGVKFDAAVGSFEASGGHVESRVAAASIRRRGGGIGVRQTNVPRPARIRTDMKALAEEAEQAATLGGRSAA